MSVVIDYSMVFAVHQQFNRASRYIREYGYADDYTVELYPDENSETGYSVMLVDLATGITEPINITDIV